MSNVRQIQPENLQELSRERDVDFVHEERVVGRRGWNVARRMPNVSWTGPKALLPAVGPASIIRFPFLPRTMVRHSTVSLAVPVVVGHAIFIILPLTSPYRTYLHPSRPVPVIPPLASRPIIAIPPPATLRHALSEISQTLRRFLPPGAPIRADPEPELDFVSCYQRRRPIPGEWRYVALDT